MMADVALLGAAMLCFAVVLGILTVEHINGRRGIDPSDWAERKEKAKDDDVKAH